MLGANTANMAVATAGEHGQHGHGYSWRTRPAWPWLQLANTASMAMATAGEHGQHGRGYS